MVKTSEIGSTTMISFQTKYPTFSGADFERVLNELGFQKNQINRGVGQIQQITFTKENLTVSIDPQTYIINFQFFNTININNKYKDVQDTITRLNIDLDSMHLMGLDCRTMAHEVGDPEDNLSSLISNSAKKNIFNLTDMAPSVYSLVLVNKDPDDEDIQIRVEPLASNPKESFFIHINYKTTSHEKFNDFIGKFGEEKVRSIAESMSEKNE